MLNHIHMHISSFHGSKVLEHGEPLADFFSKPVFLKAVSNGRGPLSVNDFVLKLWALERNNKLTFPYLFYAIYDFIENQLKKRPVQLKPRSFAHSTPTEALPLDPTSWDTWV